MDGRRRRRGTHAALRFGNPCTHRQDSRRVPLTSRLHGRGESKYMLSRLCFLAPCPSGQLATPVSMASRRRSTGTSADVEARDRYSEIRRGGTSVPLPREARQRAPSSKSSRRGAGAEIARRSVTVLIGVAGPAGGVWATATRAATVATPAATTPTLPRSDSGCSRPRVSSDMAGPRQRFDDVLGPRPIAAASPTPQRSARPPPADQTIIERVAKRGC